MEVRRIAGALGAEVTGIDLAQPLDAAAAGAIRRAWLEHLVLFFREQHLSLQDFAAFARLFGEPAAYPLLPGVEGFAEITEVKKLAHETANFGGVWHSDTTYLPQPPMGTMLLAHQLPPQGGDTLFANQYLAFEALSEGMKALLEGLVAVNSSAKAEASRTREHRLAAATTEKPAETLTGEHPVVRTHPETGRKALFVNVGHTVALRGMTEQESAPLLDFLFAHQIRPEFTCRFAWQPGSLAFWDNRAAQHNPVNDYHGHRRILHRITLAGDTPR